MRISGQFVWFDVDRGVGLLRGVDGGYARVHYTQLADERFRLPTPGERVTYERLESADGFDARRVRREADAQGGLADELAVRQATEERDRIFNLSHDLIVVANTDGYFVRVNPAWKILGYSEKELTSRPFSDFVHPEDKNATQNAVVQLRDGLHVLNFENRYICADGSIKWLSWQATPLPAEGMIYAIARDVTEQRLAATALREAKQAAEAANLAKSLFLANMSHEIRTPLTAIFGFADLLLSPEITREQHEEYVRTIRRNGEHLMSVINDVLDVSKIEAGMMRVELVRSSVSAILHDLDSLLGARARAKGLEFHISQSGAIPAVIETDPTRLKQILFNLVGNAIKFTERGGVRVEVSHKDRGGRSVLSLSVSDTGIGMTPAQQRAVFEPFVQSDATHARKYGGTGLGLTISKRLAEMLGGTIEVISEPGVGTIFTAEVLTGDLKGVRMIDRLEPTGAEAATRVEPASAGRVLLADDSPEILGLFVQMLRRMGVEPEVAGDGSEAMSKALAAQSAGHAFDLILMDMQMPGMDGYTATAELRRRGYTAPIVALTANALAQDRARCMAAGCDEFLAKPIAASKFREAVQRYLAGAGQQKA